MTRIADNDYLDCTAEVSPLRTSVPSRAWLACDVRIEDWLINLNHDVLDELHRLAGYIIDNPLQNLQRRASEFHLEHCRQVVTQMKSILDYGVGFAVLDRFPASDYPIDVLKELFWIFGQMIGRPVAQKWNGQVIYDVTDSGQTYSYGVRGSHTNVELVFHTDNAFAHVVPDYVGLFCRNPALRGGVSRFCSLYSVHQKMYEQYPKQLERLYKPMFFDRQKEHRAGAPKVTLAPFFSWRDDKLFARANSSLVRKGYAVTGREMDGDLLTALEAIDGVCASEDLWFEAPLERGQVQYLNNHEVGHYRSEFIDHQDADKKRHLFRLWHRDAGSACYDGISFN